MIRYDSERTRDMSRCEAFRGADGLLDVRLARGGHRVPTTVPPLPRRGGGGGTAMGRVRGAQGTRTGGGRRSNVDRSLPPRWVRLPAPRRRRPAEQGAMSPFGMPIDGPRAPCVRRKRQLPREAISPRLALHADEGRCHHRSAFPVRCDGTLYASACSPVPPSAVGGGSRPNPPAAPSGFPPWPVPCGEPSPHGPRRGRGLGGVRPHRGYEEVHARPDRVGGLSHTVRVATWLAID